MSPRKYECNVIEIGEKDAHGNCSVTVRSEIVGQLPDITQMLAKEVADKLKLGDRVWVTVEIEPAE